MNSSYLQQSTTFKKILVCITCNMHNTLQRIVWKVEITNSNRPSLKHSLILIQAELENNCKKNIFVTDANNKDIKANCYT